MLWHILVHFRGDVLDEYDHTVTVEADSWSGAALSIADDPEWEVVWSPPGHGEFFQ